jgi:hypothetical protein
MAGASQIPTVLGAEMITSGVMGETALLIVMLDTGMKVARSLEGRMVLAFTVTILLTSTRLEADADRVILREDVDRQKQDASALPVNVKRSLQIKEKVLSALFVDPLKPMSTVKPSEPNTADESVMPVWA